MANAYVALGGNTGNRQANLRLAVQLLTRMARVEAVSALYETQPAGPVADQPPFYNAACAIETGLEPSSLLRFLQTVEHEIGRRPGGEPGGPRPIDLDLLLYEDAVLESPRLTVPHPRLAERAFVLVPLAEIAPEVVHPVLGKSVRELAAAVAADGLRKVTEAGWDGVAGRGQRVEL